MTSSHTSARGSAQSGSSVRCWRGFRSIWITRGPDSPIYLVGAQMIAGYAISPFSQWNGVMHNVLSYYGRVFVSINGCPGVLPDVDHYADCVEASFPELTSAASSV